VFAVFAVGFFAQKTFPIGFIIGLSGLIDWFRIDTQ
jgi:hypothetical protein